MNLFDLVVNISANLDGLSSGINTAKTKVNSLSSSLGTISSKFESIGSTISGWGKTLTTMVTLPIGVLAVSAGKTAVEFLKLKENTRIAFETLLGSGEKAQQMLQDLYDYAQTSPLSYQSYLEASKQLVAMGVSANNVIPYLDKLTNAAVATGSGETGLNTLTAAVGRMSSKGKIDLEELNKMIELGVPAVKILGNAYGKSEEQIYSMMSKGELLTKDALPKLLAGMNDGTQGVNGMTAAYGGLAQKMEGTLAGAIDTVKARWRDMSTKLFDSENTYPKLTELLNNFSKALEKLPKIFESISKTIAPAMDKLNEKLEQFNTWINSASDEDLENLSKGLMALVALGPALWALGVIVKGIGTIITVVKWTMSAFSFVLGIVQGAIHGVSVAMAFLAANPIFLIIGAIVLLVAAFIYFWNTSEAFRNFWINLWSVISSACVTAWNAISNAFITAWNAISTFFTTTIPEAWNSLLVFFQGIWNGIVTFFTSTIPTFFSNAVLAIISFFEQLPYMLGFIIGQVIGYIVLFAQKLWEFATVTVPQWIASVIAWLWNFATVTIPEWIAIMIKFISELPGKIWDWLVQAAIKIRDWGIDIWNKGVTAVTNFINSVIKFFSELPGKIWNWLVETVKKVQDWGSNLGKKGSEAATSLWNSIVDGIKTLPDKIYNIGVDIVNGLWNGIKSMIDWIKQKVSSFVQGIKDGFTSVQGFDEHSPSKWSKKVFQYVVQGGIEGFDSQMGAIERATSGITDKVKAGLDIGNISYESSFAGQNSGGTSNKDIYSVMSNVLGLLTDYIPDLANRQITLDGKTIVGALVEPMDNAFGVSSALKARGTA